MYASTPLFQVFWKFKAVLGKKKQENYTGRISEILGFFIFFLAAIIKKNV